MNLRPSTSSDLDLETYLRLYRAVHPEHPRTQAQLRHQEATWGPGELSVRFFVEEDGQAVGWAGYQTPLNPLPGQLEVELGLLEGYEGLFPLLWAFLEEQARNQGAKALIVRVREDWPQRVAYQSQGFVEYDRTWASTLDLTHFNPIPQEPPLPSSIRILALAELNWHDEQVQHSFYTLITALLQEVPWAEPLEIWPFELWRSRSLENPNFIPEGNFLALDQGQMVGVSQLLRSSRPQTLQTGLTGVQPPYRRRGIARALKLRAARYAKAQGYRYIRTSNHSINRPMLALNEAMGFAKEPAWLVLKKELQT
ncbi:MAG: GNAT family N-acetyltransferase [Thermaceae bacterium]|nr:GNAT family N-acetyltransferase [Thermaceae bacterium]